MKQVLFVFSFLFLCIGTTAQSLADKELERIASGVLAETISYCSENDIRYAGIVVIEVNQEALDSLRSAMRKCVTDVDSEHVAVGAVDGYKGQFAAAFFPYEKPEYTIGVYVWRNWGKGVANPSDIARSIIDRFVFNRLSKPPYLSFEDNQSIKHRDDWVHPAAR